jgi:hypothetical protein
MKIKNWAAFQHYKHRSPPWIRLYKKLLDDPEWFALSGDASKVLAMCWLVGSENFGELPTVPKLAFRFRMAERRLIELLQELTHWLDLDASTMLAECRQHATTETETETEKKEDSSSRPVSAARLNGHPIKLIDEKLEAAFSNFYSKYPRRVSRRDAQKAYIAVRKAGVSHQTIMDGLQRAIKSDSRFREPKYTPYPASWLNAGGFEDEGDGPKRKQHWTEAL